MGKARTFRYFLHALWCCREGGGGGGGVGAGASVQARIHYITLHVI